MGTVIRVTDVLTARSVIVVVTDREPTHGRRIIDLTPAAAQQLGIYAAGKRLVHVDLVPPAEVANAR